MQKNTFFQETIGTTAQGLSYGTSPNFLLVENLLTSSKFLWYCSRRYLLFHFSCHLEERCCSEFYTIEKNKTFSQNFFCNLYALLSIAVCKIMDLLMFHKLDEAQCYCKPAAVTIWYTCFSVFRSLHSNNYRFKATIMQTKKTP